uniref:FLYWCH-type domain-containing protein n=1 Tax=Ditylenchus dipsaci TaxID=166011 RepID=A0A915CXJ9_9BILA
MVIQSNKGKPMANCGGHLMRRNKPSADGTKQYWRCATTGCQGTAESAFGSTIDLLPRINHNPITCSYTGNQDQDRMNIVKQVATANPALSSHQIVTNAKEGLSMEEIEAFPEDSNIKRRVTNARRPIGAVEADLEPAIMVLSEDLKTTANGERFLLYDSRNDHPEKPVILIYASEYGLNLLRENRKWSGDGTFFSCPKHFKQLYTLNIFKEHSSLPTVFFLLPGKSEEIYKRAFDALTRLCPDLDPDMFMAGYRHDANPLDALRNASSQKVVKAELQIKTLVDRYAAVDVLLRNTANRVKFLRHLQLHTAKFYNQDTSNEVETMDEYMD